MHQLYFLFKRYRNTWIIAVFVLYASACAVNLHTAKKNESLKNQSVVQAIRKKEYHGYECQSARSKENLNARAGKYSGMKHLEMRLSGQIPFSYIKP
jgi:hypothetical protein